MSVDFDDVANGTANLLFAIFGGLAFALSYWFCALVYCVTIIGIPFGVQLFKMGRLCLHPFGYSVEDGDGSIAGGCVSFLLNVVWFFFGGLELALMHIFIGLLFCITIIGIGFGTQHFKLALLAIHPFGKSIEKD